MSTGALSIAGGDMPRLCIFAAGSTLQREHERRDDPDSTNV